MEFLPFKNNLEDLDPSYKTDLDLCDCFGLEREREREREREEHFIADLQNT